jgi:hypothetical protein
VSTLLIGLPADTDLAGSTWDTAEVRSYHFVAGVESETDANATIVETEQSRRIRLEKNVGAETKTHTGNGAESGQSSCAG